MLAMVLAGVLTFTALGYAGEALVARPRRQQYAVLWTLIVLVAIPLGANTVVSYLADYWSNRIDQAARPG